MSKVEELIKRLKEAKEIIEKDELDEKIKAKMLGEMKNRGTTGADIADHYRDIDTNIPAAQRSNIKAGLKAQKIKEAPKPKLKIVKSKVVDLADQLIKSLGDLTKAIKPGPTLDYGKMNAKPDYAEIEANAPTISYSSSPNVAPKRYDGAKVKAEAARAKFEVERNETALQTMQRRGQVNVKKDEDETDVEKSNYGPKGAGAYNPTDNIKRKENNTGDVAGEGPNTNVKAYSSKPGQLSSKAQADVEAKEYKAKNKAQPVKVFSPEEISALNEAKSKDVKKSEDEMAQQLGKRINLQPTNAEFEQAMIARGMGVSDAQAEEMNKTHTNTFQDWFTEANKPMKKFASEEEELAYWSALGGSGGPDGNSGY